MSSQTIWAFCVAELNSMQYDSVVPGMVTCYGMRRQDMMRREQYGHVINISSMSAHRVPNGASGGSFYAATKHALRALTEGLRQEVQYLSVYR